MSLCLSLFLLSLSLYPIYLVLIPFLPATISFLSILSSFNYVVHSLSPSFGEKSAEVFEMISSSPPGFRVSVRAEGESFPESGLRGLSYQGSF